LKSLSRKIFIKIM